MFSVLLVFHPILKALLGCKFVRGNKTGLPLAGLLGRVLDGALKIDSPVVNMRLLLPMRPAVDEICDGPKEDDIWYRGERKASLEPARFGERESERRLWFIMPSCDLS